MLACPIRHTVAKLLQYLPASCCYCDEKRHHATSEWLISLIEKSQTAQLMEVTSANEIDFKVEFGPLPKS